MNATTEAKDKVSWVAISSVPGARFACPTPPLRRMAIRAREGLDEDLNAAAEAKDKVEGSCLPAKSFR